MTDTNTTAPSTDSQPVQLNVQDIVNGTILLKVSIDRGTFKTEELNEVMGVYNKLDAFVKYLQTVAAKESQEKSDAEATKSVEESPKKSKKAKK